MASTSAPSKSLESIIKSEQFPFRRVPTKTIPTVIVTNEATNSTKTTEENNDSRGLPPATGNLPAGATAKDASTNSKLKYGRVVISLENPILPDETIKNTPSMVTGLDPEIEQDLRITGCKLIQMSGILLKLPQVAMATGQILFHRYYYSKSFVLSPMEYTAMACVFLASKVEEAPRRIRDIVNVFHNMKQVRLKQPQVPLTLNEYVIIKNQVIKAERRILKELGFCVHVKHPHKYIITLADILNNSKNTQLIQAAWSYINDSLQTNVFVRFSPESVACACIHLSARILRVPLPTSPPWYQLFRVDIETIEEICKTILLLYTRKTLPQEELEEKVESARKALDEARLKAKAQQLTAQGAETPNAASMDSIMDSRTNSPKYITDAVPNLGGSTKNLEVLSVINRLKQQQNARTSPNSSINATAKSSINVANSNPNSTANSTSNTPIKLEKSPRTLVMAPTPSPRDNRRSRDRNDSYSSGDDGRGSRHSQERRSRYKNGHSNNNQRTDVYENDYRESRYRESDSYQYRSRSPPRSYVSSAVSMSNDNYHSSSKRRRDDRSPSIDSASDRYGNNYHNSRHKSLSHREERDRPSRHYEETSRHSSSRSRKDHYDNRDRRKDYQRDYRYGDDGYDRSRSRSPGGGGYRHRDDYHPSSSGNRSNKY